MSALLNGRIWSLVLLLAAVIFPFLTENQYYLHILSMAFIWAIAVYGLNLISGYTGYLSLAQAGFFAVGAYSAGLLMVKTGLNFWLALAAAILITAAAGFLIGLVSLRTKEHFFAIYTLCVGYIIYLIIYKWEELTEGVRGLIGIPHPAPLGPFSFETPRSQYYLLLFFLVLVILMMKRIVHSLVGSTYTAIRNSEELAEAIGINVMKQKLVSFVVSTVFAGLAGALYASFVRFIGPDISYVSITFDMLTYLIVGGIGTLAGPLVGTILIVALTQSLQFLEDFRMLIFGPLLIALIIFYPRGIAGGVSSWLRSKRKETVFAAGMKGTVNVKEESQ